MNRTLEELNAAESRIMEEVAAIKGTIEEQTAKIDKAGIFSEYRSVHKAYVQLIKNGTESEKREALKRALFIQWYGISEPSFNTGIEYEVIEYRNDGIAWEDVVFVISELNRLLSKNELDEEILAMLSYYVTWDFIFQDKDFLKFEHLQKFVREHAQSNGKHVQEVRNFNLTNRGQMGEYWLSLNLY